MELFIIHLIAIYLTVGVGYFLNDLALDLRANEERKTCIEIAWLITMWPRDMLVHSDWH